MSSYRNDQFEVRLLSLGYTPNTTVKAVSGRHELELPLWPRGFFGLSLSGIDGARRVCCNAC